MKKTNVSNSIQLAVLSAATMCADSIAILGAELKNNGQGLIQLLPYGKFKAVDGRPADVSDKHWLMDETTLAQLKQNSTYAVNDLVIDYEHQTLKAEKNGQPAIAAGYFNIKDLQLIKGKGLFIKPSWTDKAQAHLNAGEYKYISAVFGYDTKTGRPTFLHSAGLVNRPGLDGMQPLADLAAQQISNSSNNINQEENAVNTVLLAILEALGIKVTGDLPTEPAALSTLQTQVTTALAALQTDADKVPGLNTQIAALSANNGNPDPSEFVPLAALTELQATVAQLQAEQTSGLVDNLVSLGMENGKLSKNMEAWARELGNKDVLQLKAYLDAAPAIAALKGKQTDQLNLDDNNADNDVAALSADDKEAATLLGMSEEEFAKQKTADNKGAK